VRGAERVAGLGESDVAGFDDAEVHELHPALGVQVDVVWLDVAVDQPQGVNVGQRLGQLEANGDPFAEGDLFTGLQGVLERLTGQELQNHERDAVFLAIVVGGDDVFVGDSGGDACLQQEPGAGVVVGSRLGGEQFHGDGAAEDRVTGLIDLRHAAAEVSVQLVF
jgi:hypothetical protein